METHKLWNNKWAICSLREAGTLCPYECHIIFVAEIDPETADSNDRLGMQ